MAQSRIPAAALALLISVCVPAAARGYSVFAHETTIDVLWQPVVEPLLKQRFPASTSDDLRKARAYAYGGALIQDLGYYPSGSKLFSNLVHYVRAGDFVEALLGEARDVDELAFALGALSHYASDIQAHALATNKVVPMMYPKLRAEHGDEVIYADSPSRHVMVEFAYDVSQVARGGFAADAYRAFIGFEVAMPLLERAFARTYGLQLRTLFRDADQAIGTYRWAVSKTIPEMTILAWRDKRDELVYTISDQELERTFGVKYRKPGILARFIMVVFKVLPKVGPLKPLAFEPLTSDAERLFAASVRAAHARYREVLLQVTRGRIDLADADLDTGHRPARGRNPLADETYTELLQRHARLQFASMPASLRDAINAYYGNPVPQPRDAQEFRKQQTKAAKLLAALNSPSARR